jgi:hypothetical protein
MQGIASLRTFLILLSVGIICNYSCKKPDETYPEFTIDKPLENSEWSVFDTIPFQITMKSFRAIKQVQINIVNLNQVPVTSLSVITPEQGQTVISGEHIIDNISLPSGMYYLRVTVYDELNNSTNRFVRIQISEMPLESEALFIVTKKNSSTLHIYRCDELPDCQKVLTLYTDFSASALNSVNGHLYICGRYSGPLAAYDLRNGHELLWKEDAVNSPPFPFFTGMSWDGKYVVAGYHDNRVKGFFPSGMQSFAFILDEFFPEVFLRHYDSQQQKDYLIIGATHFSALANAISVHYDQSYTNMQFLMTTKKVTHMFSKNSNEVYIFGNSGQQGFMEIYSISSNNTYVLKTLPTGKLFDVVPVRPGIFILSHETGLLMYNFGNNSLTPYGSFTEGGSLAYDESSDKIFFGHQNSFSIIDFLTVNIEGNINLADSIMGMHILYNK